MLDARRQSANPKLAEVKHVVADVFADVYCYPGPVLDLRRKAKLEELAEDLSAVGVQRARREPPLEVQIVEVTALGG